MHKNYEIILMKSKSTDILYQWPSQNGIIFTQIQEKSWKIMSRNAST